MVLPNIISLHLRDEQAIGHHPNTPVAHQCLLNTNPNTKNHGTLKASLAEFTELQRKPYSKWLLINHCIENLQRPNLVEQTWQKGET
jgi:hypothetical protein